MKKYLFSVVAIAAMLAMSAFTVAKNLKTEGTFYKFIGDRSSYDDLENPEMYTRVDFPCDNGSHVCGVILDTDNGPSSNPDGTEFDAVKDDLSLSETQGTSQVPGVILMKN